MNITVEQLLAKIGQLSVLADLKDTQIAELQARIAGLESVRQAEDGPPEQPGHGDLTGNDQHTVPETQQMTPPDSVRS